MPLRDVPLGVFPVEGGIRVSVYSLNASSVSFCLFDEQGEHRFMLERDAHGLHSAFIAGAKVGQAYGFRADGAYDLGIGHMFDASKLLIDPLARAVGAPFKWHTDFAIYGRDTAAIAPKGIIAPAIHSGAARPVQQPKLIYEVQVKALTKLHPEIPEAERGTLAAVAHPAIIEHMKKLGVDTIEFMPLMAWADERHLAVVNLSNAWGYNPYCFGAPDPRLVPGGWDEVQATCAKLHEAGFQLVLDVVYNHTGESDLGGPTLSLRGLDNSTYYRMVAGQLVNDTGCGNTLATEHPAVMAMVLQSQRMWIAAGIDGFRYDLATVLGRNAHGFDAANPLLRAIRDDAVIGKTLHIAEPWDIGPGGYQLGQFPAGWSEWNDRYRDDVRHFWRGDGWVGDFATRLAGSSDLFNKPGRSPAASINFIAAHDGFTLADTVSFAHKHNFANGEENRDGNAGEVSWVASDPHRDVRALLATLFMSRGTLMLTAGDEMGRTQGGNNNAYAQDNASTWLNWRAADHSLIDEVAALSALRREKASYFADRFLAGNGSPLPDVQWLDGHGVMENWDGERLLIGISLSSPESPRRFLAYFNRGPAEINVVLPPAQDGFEWSVADLLVPGRSVVHVSEREQGKYRSTPADDSDVSRVAAAAGIQGEWWEVNGTHHNVSVETKRALLAAMGLEVKSRGDVQDHLWALRKTADLSQAEPSHEDALVKSSRFFGLSAHLYALRHDSDWGIGDFETLSQTAEATGVMGGRLLGINPLHHMFTDDRERASPYQPSDRRFVDPIYIDVTALTSRKPPEIEALRAKHYVDYTGVWQAKDKALRDVFKQFKGSSAYDAFVAAGGAALQDHARFESRHDASRFDYALWLQWIADKQLGIAAQRAKTAGVTLGLYRDLALGCAYEGGEVWARPHLYATSVSLGAPPDPFSAAGQVWELPPFNPLALAAAGYEPLREILAANMRHAGVLRIDHVLGLTRQFWVPRGATGADGAYVTMPVNRLLSLVAEESKRASCSIIGEDLGTVPDGFRDKLWANNLLSYRVLWFEQTAQGYLAPDSYPRQAAVCLSSHDLPPLKGWDMHASDHDRDQLWSALKAHTAHTGDLLSDAHEYIAQTPCAIMLVQADDLSGETEPLNVPGTDKERPNWRRRLSVVSSKLPEQATTQNVLNAIRRGKRLT